MAGAAPDHSRCPRCGGGFHCGVDDPAPCVCTMLRPAAALLAVLRRRQRGGLCPRCLAELARAGADDGRGPGDSTQTGRPIGELPPADAGVQVTKGRRMIEVLGAAVATPKAGARSSA